jgi:hypothetical protein
VGGKAERGRSVNSLLWQQKQAAEYLWNPGKELNLFLQFTDAFYMFTISIITKLP